MHRGVTRSWKISPRIFMEDIYPKADSQGHLNGNFPWNFSSWKCQDSMAHGEFGTWNLQEEHPTGDTLWGQDPAPFEQPKSTVLMVVAAALVVFGVLHKAGSLQVEFRSLTARQMKMEKLRNNQYLLLMEKTSGDSPVDMVNYPIIYSVFYTFQVVQDFWTIKSISDMSLDFDFIFLDDSMDEIYNWWSWKADRTGDARFRRAADKAFQASLYVPCENNSSRFDQKRAFGIQPSMWYPLGSMGLVYLPTWKTIKISKMWVNKPVSWMLWEMELLTDVLIFDSPPPEGSPVC